MSPSELPPVKRRNRHTTVFIGPEEKQFMVHHDVLIRHCAFFQDKSEDTKVQYQHPSLDPDTFFIFSQWMYTDKLVLMESKDEIWDSDGIQKWTVLSKLYRIADVLDAAALRNHIVNLLLHNMTKQLRQPGAKIISIVYANTPRHSMLRKVLADHYKSRPQGRWLEKNQENLPADFAWDLAVGWSSSGLDIRNLPAPTNVKACVYHHHDANLPPCD